MSLHLLSGLGGSVGANIAVPNYITKHETLYKEEDNEEIQLRVEGETFPLDREEESVGSVRFHVEEDYKDNNAEIYTEDPVLKRIVERLFQKPEDLQSTDKSFLDLLSELSDESLDKFVNWIQAKHIKNLLTVMNSALPKEFQIQLTELTFNNLTYQDEKGHYLLKNVSGYMKPGTLTAVIGAADSGVTTLLNCLTNRINNANGLSGNLLINGHVPYKNFRQAVGYITKEDYNLAHLTVAETAYFSARLRLPQHIPRFLIQFRVKLILKILNLSHVANTIVGDNITRGISGGEKRRVSVACEAVAGHSALIADLPTNGLDSTSSFSLFYHIKEAISGGLCVLSSLVQASPQLFDLFDMVLLLSKGSTMYFGPRQYILDHLAAQGFSKPMNKETADFCEELSAFPEKYWANRAVPLQPRLSPLQFTEIMRAILGEEHSESFSMQQVKLKFEQLKRETLEQSKQRRLEIAKITNNEEMKQQVNALAQTQLLSDENNKKNLRYEAWNRLLQGFENSAFNEDLHYQIRNKNTELNEDFSDNQQRNVKQFNSSYFTQLQECIIRAGKLTYRNKGLWAGNWLRAVVMGLVVGSLFNGLGHSIADVRTRMGLLYFNISFVVSGAVQLISVLNSQRNVFYEQTEGGYYSGFLYYLATILLQIPLSIIEVFLYILIVYPIASLVNGVGSINFLYNLISLIMMNLTGKSLVLLSTGVTPTQQASQALTGIITIMVTIFCGYLEPKALIPTAWRWFVHNNLVCCCFVSCFATNYS
jgi:ABC-type multidrug transport system ATPase subunit